MLRQGSLPHHPGRRFLAVSLIAAAVTAPALSRDPGSSDEIVLAPEKQAVIWDAEHMTFKFERYFAPRFVEQLDRSDPEALGALFATDAACELLKAHPGVLKGGEVVWEHRRSVDQAGKERVPPAKVVQQLVRARGEVGQIERGRLRILRIGRVESESGAPPAERWSVSLLLTLFGRNGQGQPRYLESKQEAEFSFTPDAAERDEPDRDDEPDQPDPRERPAGDDAGAGGEILLTRFQMKSETLRGADRFLMQEVTESAGLTELGLVDNWELEVDKTLQYRYQIAVADYDRDGYLDIAVGSPKPTPMLLRSQEGGRFVDVAREVGLHALSLRPQLRNALVGWIDYDNDGYPDLIAAGSLFHNVRGERFENVTSRSRLSFDLVPLGIAVADYDADGWPDLYIAYQKGFSSAPRSKPGWVDDDTSGAENQLWRNQGDGTFRNVTRKASAGGGLRQTFAASFFHWDADRFPDLYLANDFGRNLLLRNTGTGTFEMVEGAAGAGDYATSMGVAAGDLDNDGTTDLYVANMFSKMGRRIIEHVGPEDYPDGVFEQIAGSCAGNRLYTRAASTEGFQDISESMGVNGVGWAYAPAMSDLDGDGWLDLYATTGFMSFNRNEPDG